MAEASGVVTVEKVRGRSTVTRCFFRYPLKLILPKKVGASQVDAVWIYALSYGGGIVSGDKISCKISIGDQCTASVTTQASTKVYKSVGSKFSEQILEARIGEEAFLALIPDPVTCFSTAKYDQKQSFRIVSSSNLVVVDWITSGRYQSGERWDFTSYKSTNCVYLDNDRPVFIDSSKAEAHTKSNKGRSKENDVCTATPPYYFFWSICKIGNSTRPYCSRSCSFMQYIWPPGNGFSDPCRGNKHRGCVCILANPSFFLGDVSGCSTLLPIWIVNIRNNVICCMCD
ncbi:urease accessory protein D-like isoform X2 [Carex rostrata]